MDYCSGFFENWYRYGKDLRIESFQLSELCKEHDKDCSSSTFFKLLWKHRVVGGLLIGSAGALGCWFKYTRKMINRI